MNHLALNFTRAPLALFLGFALLLGAACSGGDGETTEGGGSTGETSLGASVPGEAAGGRAEEPAALQGGTPGDVLIRAAQAAQAQSYRYAVEVGISDFPEMPGVSMDFEATGAVDVANERMQLVFDFSSIMAMLAYGGLTPEEQTEMEQMFGDGTMEIILDNEVVYMKSPLISSLLGFTTPWVSLDTAMLSEGLATPVPGFGSFGYDPSMSLSFLETLENLEEVGAAEVRGVGTTHYRGVLSLATAYDQMLEQMPPEDRAVLESALGDAELDAVFGTLPPLPIEVWVDGDGLIRRYSLTVDLADFAAADPAATPGEITGTVSVAYDLFDFGEPIAIDLPPANEVTPFDEEMMFGGMAPATY